MSQLSLDMEIVVPRSGSPDGERVTTQAPREGISGHERGADGKEEWLTPREITDSLGAFDLDPCSPINRPWPTARRHYTITDDGLAQTWEGRVWLNPPYGDQTERWIERLAHHGNGIALIFARTETATWQDWIWPHAHSIFFFRGRIKFCHLDGRKANAPAGAPSALIAYGVANAAALAALPAENGKYISLKT